MKIEPKKIQILQSFIDQEDKFSLHLDRLPTVKYSIIMITRNRAPFSEKIDQNPLLWAAESVINQKILPNEFILINDFSDLPPKDFTDKLAKKIKEECLAKKIRFIYHKNQKRENAAKARNIGAEIASNEILYFVDDDGILRPETSYGIYLFILLRQQDLNCFILNLPQNTRTSHPWILLDSREVGKIDENKLEITGSLITRFPKQYFNKPPYIDLGDLKVFKPLLLENFQGGSVVADKKILLRLGGFPDYKSEISYGEETGLALNAIKNKYHIYYFPYNNLSAVHLSYGNPSGLQQFYGKDWLEDKNYNLKKMVKESIVSRYGSGMRVEKEFYIYVKIRNFAILLDDYKKGLGEKWLKKSYDRFVTNNEITFMDNKGQIDNKALRERIWQLASDSFLQHKSMSMNKFFNEIKGVK